MPLRGIERQFIACAALYFGLSVIRLQLLLLGRKARLAHETNKKNLVNPEGKAPGGRRRHIWEDNSKVNTFSMLLCGLNSRGSG
jgi:hypothetical protein